MHGSALKRKTRIEPLGALRGCLTPGPHYARHGQAGTLWRGLRGVLYKGGSYAGVSTPKAILKVLWFIYGLKNGLACCVRGAQHSKRDTHPISRSSLRVPLEVRGSPPMAKARSPARHRARMTAWRRSITGMGSPRVLPMRGTVCRSEFEAVKMRRTR